MERTYILFVCHGNIFRSPMAEFVMDVLKGAVADDWEKVKFVETAATRALRVSETAPVRKGGNLCLLKLLKVH